MAPQPAIWLAMAFPLPPERVDMAHLMAWDIEGAGRPGPAAGCPGSPRRGGLRVRGSLVSAAAVTEATADGGRAAEIARA